MRLSVMALLPAAVAGVCNNLETCGGEICWTGSSSDFQNPNSWSSGKLPFATQKTIVEGAGVVAKVSAPLTRLAGVRVKAGSRMRVSTGSKVTVAPGCSATSCSTTCNNGACVNADSCQCNNGYTEFMLYVGNAASPLDDGSCSRKDSTSNPTVNPTSNPTFSPTASPTANPTFAPTTGPTENPTPEPTANPTVEPTSAPTESPTALPTAAPVRLALEVKSPPDAPEKLDLYQQTLAAIYKDKLNPPAGMDAKDCIIVTDANGDPFRTTSGRGGTLKFEYEIDGACNTEGTTARDFTKIMVSEMNSGSTSRVASNLGETSAKLTGSIDCPDGSIALEGEACPIEEEEANASASLPIIPIAAGGGGLLLLIVVFLVVRSKKKKGKTANKSKYKIAGDNKGATGKATVRGSATSRGQRTSRGVRTSRGAGAPPPPARVSTQKLNAALPARKGLVAPLGAGADFPKLAASRPLIGKKGSMSPRNLLNEA